MEGNFIDYVILNFNDNPNCSFVLNKLNSSNFEMLSPADAFIGGSTNQRYTELFSKSKSKSQQLLINNISFQKIKK